MEKDNVVLVRRHSGGGAVYQDLGNSIFSFLAPRVPYPERSYLTNSLIIFHLSDWFLQEIYDVDKNINILLDALERFGVRAKASGRNDIVTAEDEKKISVFF